MTNEIKGVAELVSQKFSGGIKIGQTWYNGNMVSAEFVKAVHKGDTVSFELDEKGKIKFIKTLNSAPKVDGFKPAWGANQEKIDENARLRRELDWEMCAMNNAVLLAVHGKMPVEKLLERFNTLRDARTIKVQEVIPDKGGEGH